MNPACMAYRGAAMCWGCGVGGRAACDGGTGAWGWAAGLESIVSIPWGLLPTEVMEVAGLCLPLPVGDDWPCVMVESGTVMRGSWMPCCC